ncbi:hypothetical protein TUM4636_17010 [Shewanella glacialipiscicola]|nr:hypothetical protein TUM4636_17010 [Shewanella glacialipiscicola]
MRLDFGKEFVAKPLLSAAFNKDDETAGNADVDVGTAICPARTPEMDRGPDNKLKLVSACKLARLFNVLGLSELTCGVASTRGTLGDECREGKILVAKLEANEATGAA